MDDLPPIEPIYSSSQREELDRIDYFVKELEVLAQRGLVSAEVIATVEAEKKPRLDEVLRLGRASGAMKAARAHAANNPEKAVALAEMARAFAPEQVEPPSLAAELLVRLNRYDEAIEFCKRAIDDHGHDSLRAKLATLQIEAERLDRALALGSALSRARAASCLLQLPPVCCRGSSRWPQCS